MENITISLSEYEELLAYKKDAEIRGSLARKQGSGYEKYKQMIAFDQYCKQQYGSVYSDMKKAFTQYTQGKCK